MIKNKMVIKMIDTVIFDLDGTLMDTLYDLYISTNYALEKYNLPKRSYDEIRQFVGNGIKTLIQKAIGDEHNDLLDDVFEEFCKYYEIHKMDNTKEYPDIMNLLVQLKKQKYKMAIVSNKYEAGVKEICVPLFGEYITVLMGETKELRRKPAPDMVLKAVELLDSKIENCLFVGDSETDVLTANNANMKVCGVDWGFRGEQILKKLKIDYLIYKPLELLDVLKGENKND